MTGKRLVVVVPDTPPSLNKITHVNPGYGMALKKKWANTVRVAAIEAGWKKINGGKPFTGCHIDMLFPTNREIDEDNYRKIIKDALVYAELFSGDSVQRVLFTLEIKPGTKQRLTKIVLFDRKDVRISKHKLFYKNCISNRARNAKICGECPFRELIEKEESETNNTS